MLAADGVDGPADNSPKASIFVNHTPPTRPISLGATSFRVPRTASNVGLSLALAALNGGGGGGGGGKDHLTERGGGGAGAGGGGGGVLSTRSHSVYHGGLLAPGANGGAAAADAVKDLVKDLQQRKRSIMFHHTNNQTTLDAKAGSLAMQFRAPNEVPGKVRGVWRRRRRHGALEDGQDARGGLRTFWRGLAGWLKCVGGYSRVESLELEAFQGCWESAGWQNMK